MYSLYPVRRGDGAKVGGRGHIVAADGGGAPLHVVAAGEGVERKGPAALLPFKPCIEFLYVRQMALFPVKT